VQIRHVSEPKVQPHPCEFVMKRNELLRFALIANLIYLVPSSILILLGTGGSCLEVRENLYLMILVCVLPLLLLFSAIGIIVNINKQNMRLIASVILLGLVNLLTLIWNLGCYNLSV